MTSAFWIVCRHCEETLGMIRRTEIGLKDYRWAWAIQPGWNWRDGALDRADETFRHERQLLHETLGRQRPIERVNIGREVDLPVRVRCPKCHRTAIIGEPAPGRAPANARSSVRA